MAKKEESAKREPLFSKFQKLLGSSKNKTDKNDVNAKASFDLSNESLHASSDAIESIAHNAALQVKGVHSLRDGAVEKVSSFLRRKSSGRGVEVASSSSKVSVDVYLYLDYGVNIVKVSRDVQDAVVNDIAAMTDIKVDQVDVHVLDLFVKPSAPKQKIDADNLFKDKKKRTSIKTTESADTSKTKPKRVASPKKTTNKNKKTDSKDA